VAGKNWIPVGPRLRKVEGRYHMTGKAKLFSITYMDAKMFRYI
jgi:hypothetical protein